MTSVMWRGRSGALWIEPSMPDDDDVIPRVQFLRVLPSDDRARLLAASQTRKFARGSRIWSDGDPSGEFSFVTAGRVKLVKATEGGRDAILETVAPCEVLCASAVAACAPHCCSSVAMEDDTEVLSLRRADVLEMVERSPAVARAFIRELTCRGMEMCRRVEELSAGQVEQRIAKLLLRLAERAGVDRPGQGTWVPVPLTRQDLADLCGTTVETAIRVMSRLGREGVVRTTARGFVVARRAALEEIVAGRPRGEPSPSER
jgi:CRP-like cAMP-binding protein